MKKILMTFLVMSVVAGVFADPYQIPAEDIEYKTFNKTQYVTEYVSEFTSVQDFERKHLPTNNWIRKNRQMKVRTLDPSQVFIEKNRNYGPNDVFYMGLKFDEAYTVENGVLGLNTSAYRVKNSNGGYDYHYIENEINCGEWWKTVGQGRTSKESYFMHIDGKKMFEIKFKVPRSFYGFEVFMISRDSHFDGNTDINKYRTSNNEYVDEIDFMELTTDGIRNPQETPKNYIRLRGGMHSTKNGVLVDNYNLISQYDRTFTWETFDPMTYIKNTEKWCNEWHTLNAELTPTSMVLYLDGKKYKSLSWKKTVGEIPPEQEWEIRIGPYSFDCWTNSIDWDNGEYGTFYIDYIKVYTEAK